MKSEGLPAVVPPHRTILINLLVPNYSATVVVDASMSVDAHHTKTGVMTESSMVSGWKVSGRASMSNGRNVQVRVDAPYQENNLFRFK